jgi:hypothetical protein
LRNLPSFGGVAKDDIFFMINLINISIILIEFKVIKILLKKGKFGEALNRKLQQGYFSFQNYTA